MNKEYSSVRIQLCVLDDIHLYFNFTKLYLYEL